MTEPFKQIVDVEKEHFFNRSLRPLISVEVEERTPSSIDAFNIVARIYNPYSPEDNEEWQRVVANAISRTQLEKFKDSFSEEYAVKSIVMDQLDSLYKSLWTDAMKYTRLSNTNFWGRLKWLLKS